MVLTEGILRGETQVTARAAIAGEVLAARAWRLQGSGGVPGGFVSCLARDFHFGTPVEGVIAEFLGYPPGVFFGTDWENDGKEKRWGEGSTEDTEMSGKEVQESEGENGKVKIENWGKAWGASRKELRVNGISYGEDSGPGPFANGAQGKRREQGLDTPFLPPHGVLYSKIVGLSMEKSGGYQVSDIRKRTETVRKGEGVRRGGVSWSAEKGLHGGGPAAGGVV